MHAGTAETHLPDNRLQALRNLLLSLMVLLVLCLFVEQVLVDLIVGQDGALRLEDLHDGWFCLSGKVLSQMLSGFSVECRRQLTR